MRKLRLKTGNLRSLNPQQMKTKAQVKRVQAMPTATQTISMSTTWTKTERSLMTSTTSIWMRKMEMSKKEITKRMISPN